MIDLNKCKQSCTGNTDNNVINDFVHLLGIKRKLFNTQVMKHFLTPWEKVVVKTSVSLNVHFKN